MAFQFNNRIFNSSEEMHLSIARDWLSTKEVKNREEMMALVSSKTPEEFAKEAESGWELAKNPEFRHVALVAAFASIPKNFNQSFPE